jgi:hypothetical protein
MDQANRKIALRVQRIDLPVRIVAAIGIELVRRTHPARLALRGCNFARQNAAAIEYHWLSEEWPAGPVRPEWIFRNLTEG